VKFSLKFGLKLGNKAPSPKAGYYSLWEGTMDPKEYGRKKAKEIQERRKQDDQRREVVTEEEKLKRAHAPELWEQFRKALQARFDATLQALNDLTAFKWIAKGSNEITLKSNTGMNFVSATFEPDIWRIRLSLSSTGKEYKAIIGKDGVVFSSPNSGAATPEQIAEELLDDLLKS
jgi:hypothetical protein